MIKQLFLVCLLAFSFGMLKANPDDFRRVRMGIQIAPSVIWLKANSNGLDGNGTKLGFSYGLIFDFHFNRNYAIGTGLNVGYRGGKLTVDNDLLVDEYDAVYTLQYLQLPVTLKLKTNEIGYFTYFGQIGVEPGINIRGRGTDINNYYTSSNKENIRSQINPFNVSLFIQAGLEYSLGGNASISLSPFFSNGFIDVFRDKKMDYLGELKKYDARSNVLGLSVGVMF